MRLRPELLPPAIDPGRLGKLVTLANYIVEAIDTGKDVKAFVAKFNKDAGTSLTKDDFDAFPSSTNAETFVRRALTPPPKKIAKITYEELLELVTRVCSASGSEYEIQYWLGLLQANVPDPRISDLIFWPGEYFGDGNNGRQMSPKEILDTALAAK